MAPPPSPAEALGWARDAIASGLYVVDEHYFKRCRQRRISPRAWRRVIETASSCEPYAPEHGPLAGGTSWRIVGVDYADDETTVGVETYADHLGRRVLIITVF